ncbi:amidase family protein [Microbacterium sp. No. 7]|uniref:amidase family protein n=1 Tax=Microbacterium sp. No. 7 TaxID=1714373 RepID=UPI0006D1A5BA|nr:amidase family protein [Microbacterium sp. No. 7]ALJ20352.1 amidase [Microbacterium sp. No. 7]
MSSTTPAGGIAALSQAFSAGRLTPTEALEQSLAKIAGKDPVHRAIAERNTDDARARAAASDERWRRGAPLGPLDGVPVTIKERLSMTTMPRTYGSLACTPTLPAQNEPSVDRMLEAGAVVVASTNVPDFMGTASGVSTRYGVARNAWNPAWNTGGSSAGAGSATALGYAPLNLGTDIGGSIRVPAAMSGVVGFKPSFGRVPFWNVYFGRVAGPMTRSVEDAALAMRFLSLPDARDCFAMPYQDLPWTDLDIDVSSMRIAVCTDLQEGKLVDPEIVAAVERAARVFEAAGARVEAVGPYLSHDYVSQGQAVFQAANRWTAVHDDPIVTDLDKADPQLLRSVAGTESRSAVDLIRSINMVIPLVRETCALLDAYDVVLSPTIGFLPGPAESTQLEETSRHAIFTRPLSAAGAPAVSVNCGFSAEGKPIGLQIAASRWEDLRVLRAAHWYEQHRGAEATPDWSVLD